MSSQGPAALRAAGLALLAVVAGSQFPAGLELPLDPPLVAERLYQGFFRPDDDLRWSGGEAALVFPDPGLGRAVTVEVEADGWRPRGQSAPLVELRAGGRRLVARLGQPQVLRLETRTTRSWRPELRAELRSQTFTPGGHDPRELGLRLRAARLVFGPGPAWPSPASLAWAALFAAWVGLWAARRLGPAAAAGVTWSVAAALALAHAFAPLWPPLLVPALTLGLLALAAATWSARRLAPQLVELLAQAGRLAGSALARALGLLATPATAAASTLVALVLLVALRAAPSIELTAGEGRAALVTRDFGAWDSVRGTSCRIVRPGALLDLSALGSGRYAVTLWLTRAQPARELPLVEIDGRRVSDDLDAEWRPLKLELADVPAGRPGPVLRFAHEATGVCLGRMQVERGGGLPTPFVWLCGLSLGLLAALPPAVLGFPRRASWAAAGLAWAVAAAICVLDPIVAWPHLPALTLVALAALVLSLVLAAAGARPTPGACLAAVAGFAVWFGATTWPLYRGGHFRFHSQIAQEIWNGRFLTYFLPYPGSMLSQQAQWGNVIIPHPCLFHTLAAPLAAFPGPWFPWVLKGVLALGWASLALLAALVARQVSGPRAAAWAALAFGALVPGHQLLGLGHLMTILGVWAGSLALVFLLLRAERLERRGPFWAAVGLLTLAFLSYTATLLFTGLLALGLVVWAWRREPPTAGPLLRALLLASMLAFGLYYAYWAWPFLTDSLPHLLAGARIQAAPVSVPDRWARLAAQPGKLEYSYGFAWLPPLALVGLWRARAGRARGVLVGWLLLLPLFCLLDLWFNFLLKHHYFVALPVAVGLALACSELERRGRAGQAVAFGLAAVCLARGLQEALAVATGLIP